MVALFISDIMISTRLDLIKIRWLDEDIRDFLNNKIEIEIVTSVSQKNLSICLLTLLLAALRRVLQLLRELCRSSGRDILLSNWNDAQFLLVSMDTKFDLHRNASLDEVQILFLVSSTADCAVL
uniref:Uncharacterized protein n=1 Tax=Heterorhabditis bacteriophora TaxID=37862 RepID=A0A1I7W9J9_HETBA